MKKEKIFREFLFGKIGVEYEAELERWYNEYNLEDLYDCEYNELKSVKGLSFIKNNLFYGINKERDFLREWKTPALKIFNVYTILKRFLSYTNIFYPNFDYCFSYDNCEEACHCHISLLTSKNKEDLRELAFFSQLFLLFYSRGFYRFRDTIKGLSGNTDGWIDPTIFEDPAYIPYNTKYYLFIVHELKTVEIRANENPFIPTFLYLMQYLFYLYNTDIEIKQAITNKINDLSNMVWAVYDYEIDLYEFNKFYKKEILTFIHDICFTDNRIFSFYKKFKEEKILKGYSLLIDFLNIEKKVIEKIIKDSYDINLNKAIFDKTLSYFRKKYKSFKSYEVELFFRV